MQLCFVFLLPGDTSVPVKNGAGKPGAKDFGNKFLLTADTVERNAEA